LRVLRNNGSPTTQAKRLPFAVFSSRILLGAMPTNHTIEKRLEVIENDLPLIKAGIEHLKKYSLPFPWKSLSLIASILIVVAGAYAKFYVPYEIDNHILSALNGDKAPASNEKLNATRTDLENKLTDNSSRLNGRVDDLIKRIDFLSQRIDGLIESVATSRQGTGRAYSHAVRARRSNLKNSLPVAREILDRAKKQSTVLTHKEIRNLAKDTFALLDKERTNADLRKEVWSTVLELAEYKTFVDSKVYLVRDSGNNFCRNGIADLGGIPLQDEIFANCKITYRGGEIVLRNVQYLNC
jgi:hypothetical protein